MTDSTALGFAQAHWIAAAQQPSGETVGPVEPHPSTRHAAPLPRFVRHAMELQFECARFDLIVLDLDKQSFTFVGPLRNDSEIERRLDRLNQRGRRLMSAGPVNRSMSREQAILDVELRSGYTYCDRLLSRPRASADRAADGSSL